ncbi:hypothetical protein Ocin01_07216 [Orchesella cincta]|uniref:Uncharacterized protein n=1 Tax=Orchesella cincta TaxID=48709 RepID=A0A1D2N2G1_ORCCI|nr:hypothetical protein Ocin01_07216 [Orchesella cincta]
MRKDKLCFSVCVIFAMLLTLTTICHSNFQYPNRIGISDQRRNFRNFSQQHKPFNSSLYSFSLINGLTKQRKSRSGKCHSHEHCQEHRSEKRSITNVSTVTSVNVEGIVRVVDFAFTLADISDYPKIT